MIGAVPRIRVIAEVCAAVDRFVCVGIVMWVAQRDRVASAGVACAGIRHNRRSRRPVCSPAMAVRRRVRRR